jgi:formamidopyrimidine-DNA glycosylase
MPELPEVETIARGLDKRVAGDVIESVWIGNKSNLLKSPARVIAKTLEGARIEHFRRVGKHIVGDLSEPGRKTSPRAQWIIHLGMTGRMMVCQPEDETAKHTHLVATLKSGRELRFVDPRRFGKLQVVAASSFEAPGAEPIGADREKFAKLFKGRKTPIKSALLNQALLSGIGNIYGIADTRGSYATVRFHTGSSCRGNRRWWIFGIGLRGFRWGRRVFPTATSRLSAGR